MNSRRFFVSQMETPIVSLDIDPLPAAPSMQRCGAGPSSSLVNPFLKWAGGKRRLLPHLLNAVAAAQPFRAYHEPFLGGAALYFALQDHGLLAHGARLSDSNAELIRSFACVRDRADALIVTLKELATRHSESFYYETREFMPADPVECAARFIYLNKTSYNGLYRVNRAGKFNVPFGRYTNPTICDKARLRACSEALQGAELAVADFEAVLDHARPGDLVYFDPPYAPTSRTANFTNYTPGGFGTADQQRLAHVFRELTARGVKAILSNSATEQVQPLYNGFPSQIVHSPRAINSNATGRGKVAEWIIRNF